MDSRLVGELARNHGFVTRQRALEVGVDPGAFDQFVREGSLVRVRRGVYCLPAIASAAKTLGEKQRLADRAACMRVPGPFVRSHTTAALELGLPVLLPPRTSTHVTQLRHGISARWGVVHHIAPYRPDQVVTVNGFAVLDAVRTAIDIARRYGHPFGVVAIDQARWAGHPIDAFERLLAEQMRSWPFVTRARQQLDISADGVESVAETLARDLLTELGFVGIETQFGLTDGTVRHFADLRVGRHLFEVDGDVKYVKRGGEVEVRGIAQVVLEEKRREDWFRGFHLGVSRLAWSDVWGPGRAAAKSRILREKAQTDRLWGTSIEDLERFRVTRYRRPA